MVLLDSTVVKAVTGVSSTTAVGAAVTKVAMRTVRTTENFIFDVSRSKSRSSEIVNN